MFIRLDALRVAGVSYHSDCSGLYSVLLAGVYLLIITLQVSTPRPVPFSVLKLSSNLTGTSHQLRV